MGAKINKQVQSDRLILALQKEGEGHRKEIQALSSKNKVLAVSLAQAEDNLLKQRNLSETIKAVNLLVDKIHTETNRESYRKGYWNGRRDIVITAEEMLAKEVHTTRHNLEGKKPNWWMATLIKCSTLEGGEPLAP